MALTPVIANLEEKNLVRSLRAAAENPGTAEGETLLDFSTVYRIDTAALKALEDLARIAGEKSVKVALRGVTVDVYKVLKLMKLTHHFSFVN